MITHETARRGPKSGFSGVWMFLGALVLAVLIGGGCMAKSYNGLVTAEEKVEAQWSEIQNQYKRRLDLVPQLVETVKGAADFEQDTITAVTEARASVGRLQVPESIASDPEGAQAFLQANQGLSSALSRLLVVSENYPTLRATESFQSLQDQLEGTENRIAVARRDYIEAIKGYNSRVRTFPNNFIASSFGFERLPQLEIDEPGLTEVPKIDFGE